MNQVLCGYRGGTISSAQSVTEVLCSLGTSDSQVVPILLRSSALCNVLWRADVQQLILIMVSRKAFTKC